MYVYWIYFRIVLIPNKFKYVGIKCLKHLSCLIYLNNCISEKGPETKFQGYYTTSNEGEIGPLKNSLYNQKLNMSLLQKLETLLEL